MSSPPDRPDATSWTSQAASGASGSRRVHGSDINLRSAPQLAEYRAAADLIARDAHTDVLDWGCGYGHMTRLLRERGMTVASIDWDPDVEGVVTRSLPGANDIEAQATSDPVHLPYATGAFDAVLSMGVLEHVHDPGRSLEEVHRVLKPGGTIYCFKLPNARSYLEWIARRLARRNPDFYFHGKLENDRLYSVQKARRLFETAGLEVYAARRANMLPLTITNPVATRLSPVIWEANVALSRVPVLNQLATNVQVFARTPNERD